MVSTLSSLAASGAGVRINNGIVSDDKVWNMLNKVLKMSGGWAFECYMHLHDALIMIANYDFCWNTDITYIIN